MKRELYPITLLLILLLVLLTTVVGCGPIIGGVASPAREEALEAVPPQEAREAQPVTADYEVESAQERMIIRTADLSLVVKDVESSLEEIKATVKELKGYIADSNTWHQAEQLRANLTLRVPAESLDEALERIKAVALKVESERTAGQDVTEEYTDLEAQLRNLEATEKELRELLKTVRERTGKAEEILAVHQRLTEIRGQIERIKGRMQYLERSAALATITVDLIPDELAKPIVQPGWQPLGTLRNATRSLVQALQFIVDALIWIIIFVLPVLLVLLALPAFLVWLLWRWRRGKKAASPPAASSK
jgi:hypothetical protein